MNRDAAVARIKDGLAFRTGTAIDDKIVARLQEAQRDLERGKTIPKFLLVEDSVVLLLKGAHSAVLPADFLRDDDKNPLHYYPSGNLKPFFLRRRPTYMDAVVGNVKDLNPPTGPKVYVLRGSVIDFITPSNAAYTLYWNYYKRGVLLSAGNVENEWLEETKGAPEWLMGEAGVRIAANLRDKDALEDFTNMRERGRSACFGDLLALEDSGGPIAMGENN